MHRFNSIYYSILFLGCELRELSEICTTIYDYVAYEATELWCYVRKVVAMAATECYIFLAGGYRALYKGGQAMRLS